MCFDGGRFVLQIFWHMPQFVKKLLVLVPLLHASPRDHGERKSWYGSDRMLRGLWSANTIQYKRSLKIQSEKKLAVLIWWRSMTFASFSSLRLCCSRSFSCLMARCKYNRKLRCSITFPNSSSPNSSEVSYVMYSLQRWLENSDLTDPHPVGVISWGVTGTWTDQGTVSARPLDVSELLAASGQFPNQLQPVAVQ